MTVFPLVLGIWMLLAPTMAAVAAPADAQAAAKTPEPSEAAPATDKEEPPEASPRSGAAVPSVHMIRIRAQEGSILEADEYLPPAQDDPAAGILLLHGFGESRKAWGDFPVTLARSGYRVLVIDLRGHGGSSTFLGSPERIQEDPDIAPNDLRAGIAYLRASSGVDPSRLAVIGADLGGDLACVASSLNLSRTAVALSPRSDRARLMAKPRYLSMRSVLIVATSGDQEQEAHARRLYMEARAPKDLQVVTGSEEGETILRGHPEAVAMILDWLGQNL